MRCAVNNDGDLNVTRVISNAAVAVAVECECRLICKFINVHLCVQTLSPGAWSTVTLTLTMSNGQHAQGATRLTAVCQRLWELDDSRLQPGQYVLNPQVCWVA